MPQNHFIIALLRSVCGTNGFEMNIWSKSNGNLDSAKHIYLTIKTCCSPEWTKYILYVHVFLIIRSMKRKTNGYRVENAKRYTYRQFIHFFLFEEKTTVYLKRIWLWNESKQRYSSPTNDEVLRSNATLWHFTCRQIKYTRSMWFFCKQIHNYEQISHVGLLTKCHSCIGIRFECANICTETLCAIIVMAKRLNVITKYSQILHDSTEKLSSTGCDFFD